MPKATGATARRIAKAKRDQSLAATKKRKAAATKKARAQREKSMAATMSRPLAGKAIIRPKKAVRMPNYTGTKPGRENPAVMTMPYKYFDDSDRRQKKKRKA